MCTAQEATVVSRVSKLAEYLDYEPRESLETRPDFNAAHTERHEGLRGGKMLTDSFGRFHDYLRISLTVSADPNS